jgi:hypothetical protein
MMDAGNSTFKARVKKWTREALSLTWRLTLVILPAVGAGILLLLLYLQNTTVHLVVFGFTATICLGLLAGFMSRWLLKKRSPALRFLAAAVALFAGLVVMYMVSSGMLGLSPYIRSAIDWYGLVQIVFGLGAVYIALYGFRRKRGTIETSSPVDMPSSSAILVEPHASLPVPAAAIAVTVANSPSTTTRRSKASIKKGTKKNKLVVGKKAAAKTGTSKGKSRRKVTLAAFDEHRCPYCLEEVKRNDPRGVVICPICKAYHHKDCWDITGRCQVPHDTPA